MNPMTLETPVTGVERLGHKQCIAGLVLGIGSILFGVVPVFGLAAGIVGLVLSVKGRARSLDNRAYYSMGTAGEVTSIIGLVWGGLATFVSLFALAGTFAR
jgi:hypothetical protein